VKLYPKTRDLLPASCHFPEFVRANFVVCIGKLECGLVTVKHRALRVHDLDVVAVEAPHLAGVGIDCFVLEFLQSSQQAAIAVPASVEILQLQSVLAHFLWLRALEASEVGIDLQALAHKGFVAEVAGFLVVSLPPPSLLLFSQILLLLQVTLLAAAIADSLGQRCSRLRIVRKSPRDIRGF
jgi:hypothetical protein